jgi:chaperonin cofactor prefoldin
MSGNNHTRDDAVDSAVFEEWVENTAEKRDISRGEVLDQMLSSYWILEELTGMVDEEQDGVTSRLVGQESNDDSIETESSPKDSGVSERDVSAVKEGRDGTESKENNLGWQGMDDSQSTQPTSAQGPPQETLPDLQTRLKELSVGLTEVQDRHSEDISQLKSNIESILDILEELDSTVDGLVGYSELGLFAAELDEKLSEVNEADRTIDGRVAQLEDSQSAVRSELSNIKETQSDLDAKIEREFDGIENLFEHLMDKADELEYRTGALSETHDDDFEQVEEFVAEHKQLTALMREAHRKDVSTAVCESCTAKADLGLLEEPHCPECDHTFTGIIKGGWSPFDRATLKTDPSAETPEGSDDAASGPSNLIHNQPADGQP